VGGYGLALPPGVSADSVNAQVAGGGNDPAAWTSLGLGVVSVPLYMCCGAFSLVLNLLGFGLAFVALGRSKAGQGNRGIAIAALVVNSILLLLNLTLLVFTFGIMGFGIFSGGGP